MQLKPYFKKDTSPLQLMYRFSDIPAIISENVLSFNRQGDFKV
jgi:hypothetical protein